jgi:hypothetical protein
MNSLGMETLVLSLIDPQTMNKESPPEGIEGRGNLSIVTLSPTLSRPGRGKYSSPYLLFRSRLLRTNSLVH